MNTKRENLPQTAAEIATEFGCAESTARGWIKLMRKAGYVLPRGRASFSQIHEWRAHNPDARKDDAYPREGAPVILETLSGRMVTLESKYFDRRAERARQAEPFTQELVRINRELAEGLRRAEELTRKWKQICRLQDRLLQAVERNLRESSGG